MKIKDFISRLKRFNQDAELLLGSDEELNTLYKDIDIAYLTDLETNNLDEKKLKKVAIWGNSGSEVDE